jgi:hypothetical protein
MMKSVLAAVLAVNYAEAGFIENLFPGNQVVKTPAEPYQKPKLQQNAKMWNIVNSAGTTGASITFFGDLQIDY